MRCSKVRTILLSNGAVGEISSREKHELSAHFEKCEKCRTLAETLEKAVVAPLRQAERCFPPDRVWENIKRSIEASREESFFAVTYGWLREKLFFSRPIFALATAALALLLITLPGIQHSVQDARVSYFLSDEMDFLDSLGEGGESKGYLSVDGGIAAVDLFM